jgi:restriction system protein
MARRRNSEGIQLVLSLPWYVIVAMAAIIYAATPLVASYVSGLSPLMSQMAHPIHQLGRIALAPILLLLAFASAARAFFLREKFAQQRSLADLRALGWQLFESIVGEAFRRQGYTVTENGQGGADGGVDLVLMKAGNRYLVQCKQYRASSVSVMVVREIFGVVAAQRASGAIVVTTGTFTKDAIEFAKSQPIELIDGARLEQMVRGINGVVTPAPVGVDDPAPQSASRPPAGKSMPASRAQHSCPKCASPMVLRTARDKGMEFYGCSRYPKCRGTRQVS